MVQVARGFITLSPPEGTGFHILPLWFCSQDLIFLSVVQQSSVTKSVTESDIDSSSSDSFVICQLYSVIRDIYLFNFIFPWFNFSSFFGSYFCLYFLCMVFCLHIRKCPVSVPSTYWDQQRGPNPLEQELDHVVRYHVVAGNWNWVLLGAGSVLYHRVISQSPIH